MSRSRYIWRDGIGLIDITDTGAPGPEEKVHFLTDTPFDGLRATDGTDISTRKRHVEYMRAHGLTLMSDFKETWANAEKQRMQLKTPGAGGDRERRREAILKAMEVPASMRREIAERSRTRGKDWDE